ncbi:MULTISPECIES: hypothetical protein [unclassified Mesorhizobium]|uniref:hypothetical protein n=1 Tax=unclassified Mesorhizobium TaxID=325217 RepID=UPI001674928C|nr:MULTISPECIES: hypothetical protein [unclassified Mesorhizobium]
MVHVIPLSVGQRRLDTGNAVQYPQGSPIGGAMQGLGDHLSAVAERYQQMMAQQEAFDAELARRKFNGQIAQAEDEVTANAPADGTGLHEAMYGQVNPYDGRVVKAGLFDRLFAAALPGMPESQRANFARQKEALREAGSLRMAARQLQRRKDYEQAEVDTALKTSAIAIGSADPDDHVTFEAARQQGLDLIDKMGVDPGIKQQKAKDWFGTAAKTRFEALIAKDPQRALAMFGVGMAKAGSDGDTAQADGSSLADGPKMAGGKQGRVGIQTPDERIAQAFRDDLPRQEQEALALKAKVAKFTQDVELRVAIARAEADAPDEIARTGAYSGELPGEDAYKIIYGRDEGIRRRQGLEWQTDVGKQIFDMGTMPNQAIHAALRDADAGPNTSPEDQARREATAVAAKLVLERRRADSGGYVSDLSSDISTGWNAVFGSGPSDPEAYDQDTYDRTIELSVAKQKALGIDDENLQPVPFSILLKLAEARDSGGMYFMDNYAKASELFARTKGPVARATLVRELDDAGLGGILPGGKPRLSAIEVLPADANALGKVAANAGIAVANVNDWIAYGMSGGTISPPDYKDAYYEPSNNVEKVMMRQGSDALGWAIPMPAFGRTAEAAIPRAIGSVGSGAAKRSTSSLETASAPTSDVAVGRLEKVGGGEGTESARPANVQPEDFNKQFTESLDAAGGLPTVDSNALSDATMPSPAQGVRRAIRSPRKSKLDRRIFAEVASELFARDVNRVEHPGAKFGEATTNNYRKTYAEANPDVDIKDLVIHHQAEQQLLNRILSFLSDKKMNSIENLRGIPKKINDILHLVILRMENDKFHEMFPHPTEQQILDHSTMMDKKYGHLFVPPVGKYR